MKNCLYFFIFNLFILFSYILCFNNFNYKYISSRLFLKSSSFSSSSFSSSSSNSNSNSNINFNSNKLNNKDSNLRNVVIIGSGPAGYTAGIYTSRALLKPLVISGYNPGGQLTLTSEVENYPGYPNGVDGNRLIDDLKKQAERFGTEFWNTNCEKIDFNYYPYKLHLSNCTIEAKSIIIATGAESIWLNAENENQFKGLGISTCAVCDGALFKDQDVVVVGGGDSAMEEALFLTRFAKSVTILNRSSKLRASKIMQQRVLKNSKIHILTNRVVNRWLGKGNLLQSAEIKNTCDNSIEEIPCTGAFIAIGHHPNTDFLKNNNLNDDSNKKQIQLSDGYIQVKDNTNTNIPGIFACGDVVDRKYRQAITAASSGCQAAMDAESWLQHQSN